MRERYSRLCTLAENQYTPGAPVLIRACALLKDNQTGNILAQLKFQNISPKTIHAVKVSLSTYDAFGKKLEGVPEYQYLDLSASRNCEFGHKEGIPLSDPVTRSYEPKCTAVVFHDGSVWNAADDALWTPMPRQSGIYNQLGNLAEQYQRDTSARSRFVPAEHQDLWFCSCGAINHRGEARCHLCKHTKTALFAALDISALRQRKELYERELAEQQAAAAKARRDRLLKPFICIAAFFTSKKRCFKILRFAAIGAVCAALFFVLNTDLPFINYSKAATLMEEGNYPEAIALFESLDDYRDSAEQIRECCYLQATALLDAGSVKEAHELFISLNDYKDSAETAESIRETHQPLFAQPGDYIKFGAYEQDNNAANGSEELEWLVLNKTDDKILLISKYALDSKPFHNGSSANWETSSLREWLNSTFLHTAFTEEERSLICTTDLPGDGDSSGSITQDKLFLLSRNEVNAYRLSKNGWNCTATEYAISQGILQNNDLERCQWLLRSNGKSTTYVAVVSGNFVKSNSHKVSDTGLAIRPALWIDLSAAN